MDKFKCIILFSFVLICICGCSSNYLNSTTIINSHSKLNTKETNINNNIININKDFLFDSIKSITTTERSFGSSGEIKSSKFLSDKLKSYGYNVELDSFPVYEQNSSYIYNEPTNLKPLNNTPLGNATNIIATSDNYDSNKQTLYLTAHYDTESDTVGVIDNATGTSALLELSRVLQKHTLPFNIKIIFFSAEEHGIFGSRYFTSTLSDNDKKNIIGNINLDMIGEKNAGDIIVQTSSGKNNVLSIMLNDFSNEKFKLLTGGVSDEYAFYISKIPSITFSNESSKTFDGNNQMDFIDIDQLKNLTEYIANFIINFNINSYEKIINSKYNYDSYNYPKDIMNLNNFELLSIKENLLPNGYDSSYIYKYLDKNSNEYTLVESDSRLIDSSKFKDFKILDNDNGYMYKVISNSPKSTKIAYKWGSTYGILSSKASIEDSLKLLNTYYSNFYEHIFQEKPISKLTYN